MKKALLFSLTPILLSCDSLPDEKLLVTIDNQTGNTISTVGIYTMQSVNEQTQLTATDSVRVGSIPPGTNRTATLTERRLKQTDGGFRAELTDSGGVTRRFGFGYFSNGSFLDKGYTLTVKSDTILVQSN